MVDAAANVSRRPAARSGRERLALTERVYRARRIGTTFGRIYLGAKTHQFIERRLAPGDMQRRWSRYHAQSARAIRDAAIELRGLILKGCQYLGARPDALPPEYSAILGSLQDRVPPRSFEVACGIVEQELGRPLGSIFASFSPQPIAAASLAQVHAATLPDGREVAVKVQYPEVADAVHSDLSNLRALFRAVGLFERDLDLSPLVQELGETVPRELDFVQEGRNAERIAAFFAEQPDVHVPGIHWDLSSERVLVMERVEGIKIDDARALREAGVDTNALVHRLAQLFCEQVFVHGAFHADPHPGNLFVQPAQQWGGDRARIVLLDFGLVKELPESFRAGTLELAGALLQGDAAKMARALAALGFETRDGDPRALEPVAEVVLRIAQQLRGQAYFDRKSRRDARSELPRMLRENPLVRVPSHLVLLGRVLGLLSGIGRALDARIDLVKTILPYAAGVATGRSVVPPAERE